MKKALSLIVLLGLSASAHAGVVTWQCDMSVQQALGNFNPASDLVVVRGGFNGWGGTNPTLTDGDGDGIFTGGYEHGSYAGPFEYKYVIVYGGTSDSWEFTSNRTYSYDGTDVTLPVDFYNNVTEVPGVCNVEITFNVDMGVQAATGGFDSATQGVFYRGPYNGWGGYAEQLLDIDGDGIYSIELQFTDLDEATCVEHKFVIATDDGFGNFGGDNWESSSNRCAYGDCMMLDNDADGFKELALDAVFFSDVNWDAIIDHDVTVTFNVDMTRVACWYSQNDPTGLGWPYEDLGSYEAINFVSVHGFFNGWPGWDGTIDSQYHLLSTGGYNFSGSQFFATGSSKNQVYKYGANGFDNEAGFGADHSMDLSADNGTGILIVNDIFGSLGDYWAECEFTVDAEEVPSSFQLAQNFPNPFNPTTTISFSVEETSVASLKVFDISGAQVATLVDGLVEAGSHELSFDASSLSSGVYVYSLQVGANVESRKMVLVK